jgi:hypothetical protein
MLLATKNQSLQIDLAGAVAANELQWSVEYVNRSKDGKAEHPTMARGVTAGTTDTEMVPAPTQQWGGGIVRDIKNIQVYNPDTSAATVTIQILDGTTKCTMIKATLQPTETLAYEEGAGWQVLTANGVLKVGLGTSPGQLLSKIAHFSAAEIIASNTTPLVVLDHSAMVTAGELVATDTLIFHGAILQIDGGADNYDQNQNTIAKYQTAGGGASVSLTLANFFNGGADNKMSTLKPIATDVALEADQDIVLTSSASPKNAAGDRELNVQVFYSIYKRV